MKIKKITWHEARVIIYQYFNFWIDGEDRIWAKKVWIVLENAGFNTMPSEYEDVIHLRIALLALIYQEFAHRLGYDYKSLQEQHYKNIFKYPIELIDDEFHIMNEFLLNHYGDKSLFFSMFESVYRGANGSLLDYQVTNALDEAKKDMEQFGMPAYRAYRFLADGGSDVFSFESCGGLGYF